jgi:hypothetical protein
MIKRIVAHFFFIKRPTHPNTPAKTAIAKAAVTQAGTLL